ncbi:hypothetical protein DVR12_14340 [Chitinophaga silvatica]|uniref:Uncharacterized protein n=1 Tax=Chitinophaga silvatica TaxID=2282649 RepID=A0A3E1Y8U2_9BACT|nr:hypothetical protein [Chitinophaga silvatica]RFS21832.1 hypothetical protein DVR12_14340 [Chitinophaga silvatica]
MKSSCACHTKTGIRNSKPTSTTGANGFVKRVKKSVSWLIPGITLVLIPKCPICLAAYIAIGTGITLSITVATYLRIGLVVLCIGVLAWALVRTLKTKNSSSNI